MCMSMYGADRRGKGGAGCPEPPTLSLENHKDIGFLSNTVTDPLENHKATKPAFINGPLLGGGGGGRILYH